MGRQSLLRVHFSHSLFFVRGYVGGSSGKALFLAGGKARLLAGGGKARLLAGGGKARLLAAKHVFGGKARPLALKHVCWR
jgi:hypothetical protein